MKKAMSLTFAIASLAAWADFAQLNHAWIRGTTDKCPIEYKCGEKMTITLTPMDVKGDLKAGEYFLSWTRSGDDGIRETGKQPFDGKMPFVYSTKIDKPGFVRLQATVVDAKGVAFKKKYDGDTTTPEGKQAMNRFERSNKSVFFDGGAGAEIEKLDIIPEPKDFDEFWKRQYARLDLVPIKAERIEINKHRKNIRTFAVSIACAGLRPVTGYLTVPATAEQGRKFPCRLTTHGYSGYGCTHSGAQFGSENEIELNINAHGLKLPAFGATEADTKALRWEVSCHNPAARFKTYAFDPEQNADPEVAYFNGMVLRVKRALQYLKTLSEWNGRDLIASGGSQGGLQTIWAAGCGEGVTRAESAITWCCDLNTTGKFRLNPEFKLSGDGWYIPWTDAMGYFDAVSFARRIPASCFTFITRAGVGDYCCPPAGLAKLWNNIPGNKKILWVQGSQHGYVPPAYEGRDIIREVK